MPLAAEPIVIGHRGVPAERLEHTRPSYALAIVQGADYIEPDLVASKDGVLIVRHENEIGGTTNVADHRQFADRHTTKVIDGKEISGWFTEDFTLAELKSLGTRERIPALRPQNVPLADYEPMLTFDEVLDIAEDHGGHGVYVETKHPTYFASIGLDLNDLLIENLERRGLNHESADIIIQSMETTNLKSLRDRTPLKLIQLMEVGTAPFDLLSAGDPRDYAALTDPDELRVLAQWADGIGPHKGFVMGRDSAGYLTEATSLVADAHDLGLLVHIWTLRNENAFLPADFRSGEDKAGLGDGLAECLAYFNAGVDGVFADHAATAVAARSQWVRS